MATKVRIKNRLRALREARGISQEAAAEALGVSFSTYNGWETGRVNIKQDRAMQLAAFYDVSPESIFDPHGPMRSIEVTRAAADRWVANPTLSAAQRYEVRVEPRQVPDQVELEGVRIDDDHCDLPYPAGSVVFVMPLQQDAGALTAERRYVLERKRGDLKQCCVRRLREIDGRKWWVAESTRPDVEAFVNEWTAQEPLDIIGRIRGAITTE